MPNSEVLAWLKENAAVISALTALIAVFLGPLVAYLVARKQLYANLVVANKIKRLESIQDDIAAFCEGYIAGRGYIFDMHRAHGEDKKRLEREMQQQAVRLSKIQIGLSLRLDGNKKAQGKLIHILFQGLEHLNDFDKSKDKPAPGQEFIDEVGTTSRMVLTQEWEDIRRGF